MDLPILTAKQSAHCYAVGVMSILILGTTSLVALCFIALWAIVQVCATIVLSLIATLATVQAAYTALSPIAQLITLLILVGVPLAFVARRLGILTWRTR